MTGENGEKQAGASLTLPAIITIETVEALAAECKRLPLAEKTRLTLDASQVETITMPGLQLLLSLEKTVSTQGGALVINGRPEALVRACADAGLENLLGAAA